MSLYKADAWYLVQGETLVVLRYGLYSLIRDIREGDHLTAEQLLERLQNIKDTLPESPKETEQAGV